MRTQSWVYICVDIWRSNDIHTSTLPTTQKKISHPCQPPSPIQLVSNQLCETMIECFGKITTNNCTSLLLLSIGKCKMLVRGRVPIAYTKNCIDHREEKNKHMEAKEDFYQTTLQHARTDFREQVHQCLATDTTSLYTSWIGLTFASPNKRKTPMEE